mmetsp:Transcript_21349/g.55733  ORF Transcript_21349/g.55733 Transcript_21349/m.55733 type:complete len:500 (+) Transcript_21349:168-1667(+)
MKGGVVWVVWGAALGAIVCRTDADPGMEAAAGSPVGSFALPDPSVAFELEFIRPDDEGLAELLAKSYEPEPMALRTAALEGYQCYMPNGDRPGAADGGSDGNADDTVPSMSEVLQGLETQCIYRLEPYWSYEFCHGKHVRQYHEEVETLPNGKKAKKLTEHFLGLAGSDSGGGDGGGDTATQPATFVYRGKQTVYHSVTLGGGDLCDLTKQPRTTEVRFVCDQDMLHAFESISEVSTCNYLIVIQTSMVCQHPKFAADATESKKALCVGDADSPVRPVRLAELEDKLASEAESRATAAAEAQRVAQAAQAKAQAAQGGGEGVDPTGQRRGNRPREVQGGGGGGTAAKAVNPKAQAAAAKKLLTRFFQGKQCFGGGQGWWQHEFCYKKHVKQVHTNPDGTRIEINLGTWDMEYHLEALAKIGGHRSTNSMTHFYGNGDFCDETKQPRQAKVKMMCSRSLTGTQVALSLHETSTCKYTLKVQSKLFCSIMKTVDDQGFPEL